MKYLNGVQAQHVVVDIGSGTGFFAEKIFEARQLKKRIWCVDPSPEMQTVAKQRKGVYAVRKTAEEFVDDLEVDQLFDRVLCLSSLHHFSRPVEVLKGLRAHLHPSGELLVVRAGKSTRLPHFSKAEQNYRDIVENYSKERITAMLREADFEIEVSEEKIIWIVKKSRWYEMLRGRFQSTLHEFTDEEIEEGIVELENGKLKGLKLDDDVEILYIYLVFRATKPTT